MTVGTTNREKHDFKLHLTVSKLYSKFGVPATPNCESLGVHDAERVIHEQVLTTQSSRLQLIKSHPPMLNRRTEFSNGLEEGRTFGYAILLNRQDPVDTTETLTPL